MKTILLKIQLNDLKEEWTRSCTEYDIYKDGYIQKEKSLGMLNKQLEIANISSKKLGDIKILKTDNKTLVFEIYVIDSNTSFSFKCENTNCVINNKSLIIYNYTYIKIRKKMTKEEWMHQYQQVFLPEEQSTNFKDTKREHRMERCGDCTFFSEKGCTTSHVEAKYGCKSTPACSDFIPKKRS